ncbi:hypothetical protein TorRG33x02_316890 [Trema orientale]|uniref:Uncharacterized protein n=1 Tax=Trema orientale TaxID=63057 RepID=A0A2P5BLE8_TREOI|nr:hypothetical protein TorRG33x02_316890 [Trema orientale]
MIEYEDPTTTVLGYSPVKTRSRFKNYQILENDIFINNFEK